MANVFTTGDLVISVYGDGNNDGTYADNQASPIVLEDVSTSGTVGAKLVLPQTATTVNGVTQNAISGEYGSSSEGTLQLSADGKSLTIVGYAINAATYNNAEAGVTGSKAAGGAYGNNALAQTYSVPNGGTNGAPAGVTPVARVVADIRADGTVDTSTALFNIDNENNPRSVVTTDGTSFYIAGQGVKGDATQGLFYALDGASSATAINTTTDQRTVEIANGNLYVSTDSTQKSASSGTNGNTDNISVYSGLPTGAATPTVLPGISQTITLTAGQANGVNNARVGSTVYLSPENYFFANATTLYVADGGQPKGGSAGAAGLGDGGLQKWTFANNSWTLNYTLSAGLNLVANTAASGTTGLIGLTGTVNSNGTVSLYATNSTIGDLDQTYLYGITDTLAATTAPAGASFTTLVTAAADTNIRGVAFAPVCFATGTRIGTARGEVAVEALRAGDLAETASGGLRPVTWVGHRHLSADGRSLHHDQQPIRIRQGAFGRDAGGHDMPRRDLLLSPGHPVLVGADADHEGGHLVPAMCLVNGTTVERVPVASVTYWHVELDAHDILLAESLPAESYLDCGDRAFFSDAELHALANPDFVLPGLAGRCRPVAVDGPVVEAERLRLDAVFAGTLAAHCGWAALGSFDAT